MSGQQCIAWYETAMRELGFSKLMDLQILAAPNDSEHFIEVRDLLVGMSKGK